MELDSGFPGIRVGLALGLCLVTLLAAVGCRRPAEPRLTRERMLVWGEALNSYLEHNAAGGYVYPDSLDEAAAKPLPPATDEWGHPLHYRRLRGDRYRLVSRGADGTPRTADDLVMENLVFYPPNVAQGKKAKAESP